eukprot:m.370142 g.370142  ORF g.370142 m.370142 type:complete len:55 (-) comp52484_c0_seq1:39-203(-)
MPQCTCRRWVSFVYDKYDGSTLPFSVWFHFLGLLYSSSPAERFALYPNFSDALR